MMTRELHLYFDENTHSTTEYRWYSKSSVPVGVPDGYGGGLQYSGMEAEVSVCDTCGVPVLGLENHLVWHIKVIRDISVGDL